MATNIKIISWNVNGIRAVIRKEVFNPFVDKHQPDILCLQETKAMKGQAVIDLPEYEEIWNSAERKGYAGTAIFTKIKPIKVTFGIHDIKEGAMEDSFGDTQKEGRVITAEFDEFFLVTVYTPNSKRGLERLKYRHEVWDPAFLKHIKKLEKSGGAGSGSAGKPVIVCGDLNVAHKEIDLARPKDNKKNAGFTPEEREGCDNIVDSGFIDTFRLKHPDAEGEYSWWSNFRNSRGNNVGWRIDYFFASSVLEANVSDAYILQEVMGSDHAPVGVELKI
ncbi:MAG TPA: exodeoxyribonuclease III [Patescibacteria group bacterium]|nr:exodeoxyribonuclease III [Patescibacteria group bacterium]